MFLKQQKRQFLTKFAREVTVIYDDEEFKYTVEPNETILEKGLEEDVDLPFSCQSGFVHCMWVNVFLEK